MTALAKRDLTLPEAAYVTGVPERVINQEIEAHVVTPRRGRAPRRLSRDDVVYIAAVREIRAEMTPRLRKRLRAAIASALSKRDHAARVASLELPLEGAVREVEVRLEEIDRVRETFVERRPGVLGGEPVLTGTRISPYLVADMVKRGMSHAELADELELKPNEIEAALLFARVSPRRGRPQRKARGGVTVHVPAH